MLGGTIMCTSLIYQNKEKDNFLARTMDFAFNLDAEPIFLPKGYALRSEIDSTILYKTKYAFLGGGSKLDEYLFADGVNEKGISICALYFSDYAKYCNSTKESAINLAPHEIVTWVLGNIGSISELKEDIKNLNIVSVKNNLLNIVIPLHWIVADKTGESIIVEITEKGVSIYDNKVRVMTNSPDYTWHLANLNHYSFLSNKIKSPNSFYNYKPIVGELGNGAVGLPGDYTSESRFIRTVFNDEFTELGNDTMSSVNGLFHTLFSVTIPKGVKVNTDGTSDYTQYTSIIDITHLDYYMTTYENISPLKVSLNDQLLNQKEPIIFSLKKAKKIEELIY